MLEAPFFIAGFDDLAVMGETVEPGGIDLASPKSVGYSPKARLVVTMIEVRS